MIYSIRHTLTYRYSEPVYLHPHTLRLHPRLDFRHLLLDSSLHITPMPSGRCRNLDVEGNVTEIVWFDGVTQELHIESRCRLEPTEYNAFDFLLTEGAEQLPPYYPDVMAETLAPYMRPAGADPKVMTLAQAVASEAGHETTAFAAGLCARIHREFQQVRRETGDPLSPGETLSRGEGACRDLAVLYMACCRQQGIAARFVSGYYEGAASQPEKDLHAWAEVYLPGAGWRGFDPTTGLAVGEQHVPIAGGCLPAAAAPLTGSFRGAGSRSEMEARVEMVRVD